MQSEKIKEIKWFHSINLNGNITPGFKGYDLLMQEADELFKFGVKDKTVLDIGAWDGFFSFEAERRGAFRVLATDWFCWGGPGWGTQDGFLLARRTLNSGVEDLEIDIPDIVPAKVGSFDVVILSGVLYHVKSPFDILESVSKVVTDTLLIETAVSMLDTEIPAMKFLHADPANLDPTNWWSPNLPCVVEMLKACGFSSVEIGEHPTNNLTHETNPRCYFYAKK